MKKNARLLQIYKIMFTKNHLDMFSIYIFVKYDFLCQQEYYYV